MSEPGETTHLRPPITWRRCNRGSVSQAPLRMDRCKAHKSKQALGAGHGWSSAARLPACGGTDSRHMQPGDLTSAQEGGLGPSQTPWSPEHCLLKLQCGKRGGQQVGPGAAGAAGRGGGSSLPATMAPCLRPWLCTRAHPGSGKAPRPMGGSAPGAGPSAAAAGAGAAACRLRRPAKGQAVAAAANSARAARAVARRAIAACRREGEALSEEAREGRPGPGAAATARGVGTGGIAECPHCCRQSQAGVQGGAGREAVPPCSSPTPLLCRLPGRLTCVTTI